MKYLQVVGSVACVLLGIIAFELHGMRPIRVGEFNRLIEGENIEAAKKLVERLPLVEVRSIRDRVEIDR